MENILLLEFVPKSPFMSFCLFALIMTFLTCLVSKEPSSYVKNILMKHFSQNSLVDNKLKNKYKMFVIFKTSNKNFVLNKPILCIS